MSADEEMARLEHRRLNGSSRLTARASRAPAALASQLQAQKGDTATAMDTDDDSTYQAPSSALQSQTKEHTKSRLQQQSNKRMKGSDGTASSIQSPAGSIKQQPRPPAQILPVPDTDPCFAKAAAALESARRSSNIKLYYMGVAEAYKVSSQSIATRQQMAATLNTVYSDLHGIKCGKGLDLRVIFVDPSGKTAFFPAMSSAYHWQDGKEVLPDGTSWQDVSAKATAIYVCQNEYESLKLPSRGVPPFSKLQQMNLQAPRCH